MSNMLVVLSGVNATQRSQIQDRQTWEWHRVSQIRLSKLEETSGRVSGRSFNRELRYLAGSQPSMKMIVPRP